MAGTEVSAAAKSANCIYPPTPTSTHLAFSPIHFAVPRHLGRVREKLFRGLELAQHEPLDDGPKVHGLGHLQQVSLQRVALEADVDGVDKVADSTPLQAATARDLRRK